MGLFIGSIFDRGIRSDGDIRNDLPSTIGFVIGFSFNIYFAVHILYKQFEN
jgi:hypothetical protein